MGGVIFINDRIIYNNNNSLKVFDHKLNTLYDEPYYAVFMIKLNDHLILLINDTIGSEIFNLHTFEKELGPSNITPSSSIVYTQDGKMIFTDFYGNTVVWDSHETSIIPHTANAQKIKILNDGNLFILFSTEAFIWNFKTQQLSLFATRPFAPFMSAFKDIIELDDGTLIILSNSTITV